MNNAKYYEGYNCHGYAHAQVSTCLSFSVSDEAKVLVISQVVSSKIQLLCKKHS